MAHKNYAPILGALVETTTATFIGENHLKALLSVSQEQLDKAFGFKTIRMLTDVFVKVAKEKNIPLYYNNEYGVEENIFTWMPNAQVIEGESGGSITMLTKNTTEKEMLQKFWEVVEKYDTFVTFNGRAFDVPFLMVRSALAGIRPSKNLLANRYLNYHPSNARHIDLLDQLTFYGAMRKKGSLHLWCRAFGIESPKSQGVDGDDVKALYDHGKSADIARYNARDLEATTLLYQKYVTFLQF
jgi:DNA polymerase elongation subunit (family B)